MYVSNLDYSLISPAPKMATVYSETYLDCITIKKYVVFQCYWSNQIYNKMLNLKLHLINDILFSMKVLVSKYVHEFQQKIKTN